MPNERKLVAIMFTDIADYTALSAKDETAALSLLDKQTTILTPIIEKFNGTLHNRIGDGLLYTFSTVTDAIKCGIEIQKNTKNIENLNLRIGIHEGEITLKDGDVLGDDVNVASRIEPYSAIGGISISGKVQQNISSLAEYQTEYIDTPKLKGVMQEVKIFCITSHNLPKSFKQKINPTFINTKSNLNIFALTGAILTVIGVLFWIIIGVLGISFGKNEEAPSVGILIMKNLGNENDDFWARGITGDLIIKIASSGNIVIPSMKEIASIDMNKTDEEIAKRLNVKYILNSEIYKKENEFQLRSQLINIKTGVSEYANKWTESNDMAANIVNSLAEQLLQVIAPNSRISKKDQLTNSKSYQYYLEAKQYAGLNEFYKDINNNELKLARNLLEKSVLLDSTNIDAQIQWARSFYYNSEFDNASRILKNVLIISKDTNQEKMLGRVYRNLANVEYFVWGSGKGYLENMPSLNYLTKAAKIARDNNDVEGYRTSIGNIINSFTWERNSKTSIDSVYYYTNQMFEYAKEIKSNEIAATAYLKLGRYYTYANEDINYRKAEEYYNKAYNLSKDLGYDYQIGALSGLDEISFFYKEYYKGLEYLKKKEKLEIITDSKRSLASNYNRQAMYYSKIGDFNKSDVNLDLMQKYNNQLTSTNNFQLRYYVVKAQIALYTLLYEKALDYYKNKSDLNEKSDWDIYFSYKDLGIGFYFVDDYKMAKFYFEKAIEFMQLSNKVSGDIDLVVYHFLNEVKLGNIAISDTLINPLSSKKHKGTIDGFVQQIKKMNREEISLQISGLNDLYRLYYNIFIIYDLTKNIDKGKYFLDLSHKEIMFISSKLNFADKQRFFKENKWVSQILEDWEQINN